MWDEVCLEKASIDKVGRTAFIYSLIARLAYHRHIDNKFPQIPANSPWE